ncbi:MAG: 2,3-bisphosphoglycerate-independent phosphoglycerate mutase [Chloroflexi bacterium]|nr:MAG: 2,3-bisphosphoglycerate-independent phosphoglycerate mutase [Chloroflexota bacterium]
MGWRTTPVSDTPRTAPVVLVILDGWGLAAPGPGNAIELAETPVFDRLWATYPHTTLRTSGLDVGLPQGQMGNSEVGHLNLGAGFVVYQSITRIDVAIQNGDFFANPALVTAMDRSVAGGGTVHLLGLVSDGGVHSHIRHLDALLALAAQRGVTRLAIHAFLDGRDTSPTGGVGYLGDVEAMCQRHGVGHIASVVGRYWAMDRDKRWERIAVAYDLLTQAVGEVVRDPRAALLAHYQANTTDEFMPALSVEGHAATLQPGDSVIFFNFRADRARQLTQALVGPDLPDGRFADRLGGIYMVTLTDYGDYLPVEVAFPAIDVVNPIARVVSDHGLRQFHSAETEKYAHVTYFFNGGREEPFPGEERLLVPSPKVATYDLRPEMSAEGVADAAVTALARGEIAFVVLNFANCDMVGHTGVLPAAIAATEAVDRQLGRVVEATLAAGGVAFVTADHGNAECMLEPGTSEPMTAHTTNPVPAILVAAAGHPAAHRRLRAGGRLADVAPTLLELLELPKPSEMTGESLLR